MNRVSMYTDIEVKFFYLGELGELGSFILDIICE